MPMQNINLQSEITKWQTATLGREVRGAAVSSLQKIQGSVNEAIQEVGNAAQGAQQATNTANALIQAADLATARANTAATNANQASINTEATRQDILTRLSNGEFRGDRGEQGLQGPQGESGVMGTTAGMFCLYVDPSTGDLYVEYPDEAEPVEFEFDSATGDLYYVIE